MRRFRLHCAVALVIGAGALWAADTPSLKELGGRHQLLIGTAVKATALADDTTYREVLLRHFNLLTPENELKWRRLRPTREQWDFSDADQIVDFAQRHGLHVRGHTLVWNADQHSPDWLLAQPIDPDSARSLMREHITTVMARYRGRVRDWDVVNEAVGNSDRPGAAPLVDGYWSRALGRDYLASAFRLAREADPTARLFYNDYDHGQAMGPKSDRIYALLKQLRAAGVPIDGVGLQLHCNLVNPPVRRELVENFRRLAALGLRVQVTELDVEIMTASGSLEDRLARQARIYGDVVSAAVESGCVEAVVVWGFTDRFRQNALLQRKKLPPQATPMWIFDRDYRPKPAFDAVVGALKAE